MRARLTTLQSASPAPLAVLAAVEALPEDEAGYHRRFAAARIRGEWFERTAELAAEIERLSRPGAKVWRERRDCLASAYATAERLKRMGRAAPVHGVSL